MRGIHSNCIIGDWLKGSYFFLVLDVFLHCMLIICQYLDQRFPWYCIERRAGIEWPSRSPDLLPRVFFFWGCLKHEVKHFVQFSYTIMKTFRRTWACESLSLIYSMLFFPDCLIRQLREFPSNGSTWNTLTFGRKITLKLYCSNRWYKKMTTIFGLSYGSYNWRIWPNIIRILPRILTI